MTANPGSDEALDQGCVCPVVDNAHGRRPADWPWWVMSIDCPLHAATDCPCGTSLVVCSCGEDRCPSCDPAAHGQCPETTRDTQGGGQ